MGGGAHRDRTGASSGKVLARVCLVVKERRPIFKLTRISVEVVKGCRVIYFFALPISSSSHFESLSGSVSAANN